MTSRFVRFGLPFLERHPLLMALARRAQFGVWHLSVQARALWHRDIVPDPNRTYSIDPKRIQHAVVIHKLHRNDKYRLRGRGIPGDWDKKIVPFTEAGIGVFQSLHDRFVRGLEWEETELYKKSLQIISAGTYLWGCKNKTDLDERCKGLDLSLTGSGWKVTGRSRRLQRARVIDGMPRTRYQSALAATETFFSKTASIDWPWPNF